jgi:hypothetical protein
MNKYKQIISDTLFGGNVTTFKKSSTETIQAITDQRMKDLFAEGLNQVTYFGHSSATVLDFNLDNPEEYNNPGKYPLFIAMGCLAGNFLIITLPGYIKETLSERWLLTPNRGLLHLSPVHTLVFLIILIFIIPKHIPTKRELCMASTYGEILRQT